MTKLADYLPRHQTPPSRAQKHYDLVVAQAKQLAEILRVVDIETPDLDTTRVIASPAGSERALRGIPVVGARGVGGTIMGTNPLAALISRERQR